MNENENEENGDELEFDEELWTETLAILNSNVEFEIVEKCTRCQMININQNFVQLREDEKENDKYSAYCRNLLSELYKLRSSSKFGVYLTANVVSSASSSSESKVVVGDVGKAVLRL